MLRIIPGSYYSLSSLLAEGVAGPALDSTRADTYTTAVLYKTKKGVVIGAGGFYGTKAANGPKIRAAN